MLLHSYEIFSTGKLSECEWLRAINKALLALDCHLPLAISIPYVIWNKCQNSQLSYWVPVTMFSVAKLLASWTLKTVQYATCTIKVEGLNWLRYVCV